MIQTSRLFTVIEMKVCSKCLQVLVCCSVTVARHLRVLLSISISISNVWYLFDISLSLHIPPLIFSWNFQLWSTPTKIVPSHILTFLLGMFKDTKITRFYSRTFIHSNFHLLKEKYFTHFSKWFGLSRHQREGGREIEG